MASKVSYDEFENAVVSSSQRALNVRNTRRSLSYTPSGNFSKSLDEDSVDPFESRLGNRASRSDRNMTLSAHSQSQELRSINATVSSFTLLNDPGLDASAVSKSGIAFNQCYCK